MKNIYKSLLFVSVIVNVFLLLIIVVPEKFFESVLCVLARLDWVNIIMAWIVAIPTITTSIFFYRKFNKREKNYSNLQSAIMDALDALDHFYSSMSFGNIHPFYDPVNDTETNITIRLRRAHSMLVCYCESDEVPKAFLELVLNTSDHPMVEYAEFRNLCRKELGLKELNMNKNTTYIANALIKK